MANPIIPEQADHGEHTSFWLVRHGQTDWNQTGRYQGQADPPLNALGQEEARQAARALCGHPVQAIYCSDLLRARQTGEVIAIALGIPLHLEPRLREVNLGAWEGMLYSQILLDYPAELAERQRNPLLARPPGGESLQDLAQRVKQAADEIASHHANQQVILVSHGLSLAALLAWANAFPMAEAFDHIPANAIPHWIEWLPRPG